MAKGKSKLHEVIAVEGDLESVYKKILNETATTFTKKADHFQAFIKTLTFFDDKRNEQEAGVFHEAKEMVTTVQDKLDYMIGSCVNYYDALMQKEGTNQVAKADLEVDGMTIATDVPATWLLGMESRLRTLRGVYECIPTTQPGIKWEVDKSQGNNILRAADPQKTAKTEKEWKIITLAEPTKEHPAQVERVPENHTVGYYVRQDWTGMVTPARKSELLGRIDKLIRAVKKARQRANSTEVVKHDVGRKLFKYINEGLV